MFSFERICLPADFTPQRTRDGQRTPFTSMASAAVELAVPAGGGAATTADSALQKLGELSGFTYEIRHCRLSSAGGLVNQTIAGDMPVVSADGKEILKLAFESSNRGQQFRASLTLPNGETIAELDMGAAPKQSAGGMFSSVAASYSLGPPPAVQLRVLGQAYGSFTMMKHILMCMAGQDIARWALADGSGRGMVSLEHPHMTCCFCIPDADPNFPRKRGAFGKKEMRMSVDLGSPAAAATLHLITDRTEGKQHEELSTSILRVLCQLDGVGEARKKLDLLLIGASVAALHVTHNKGGGGGGA